MGPLKSRYARRDVPIPLALADRLRAIGAGHLGRWRSATPTGPCWTPTTCGPARCSLRARRPGWSGPASTRSGTPWPLGCSPKVGMWFRSSGGSATTPRVSPSTPTYTYSTATWDSPWTLSSLHRIRTMLGSARHVHLRRCSACQRPRSPAIGTGRCICPCGRDGQRGSGCWSNGPCSTP